jgi:arylformamidase
VRPEDAAFLTDWPGLGSDCVQLLLERGVKAVGVDTLSPDVFGNATSPVHRALLGEGVVIVENLANLDRVPSRFYLMALPLKIRGGSGAPCRASALVAPAG